MALSRLGYLESLARGTLGAMIQLAFRLGAHVARVIGVTATGAVMRVLGLMHALSFAPYLRPRIVRNMRAVFPSRFRHAWVVKNLESLYQSAGSLLCLPGIKDAAVARELGTVKHREVLERLQREGRGCLMIGLHFGNHRFLAPGLAAMGFPVSALIASFPQRTTQFGVGAERAAISFRTSYARTATAKYLSTHAGGTSVQTMIDTVKQGRFLLLLADGCIGRQRAVVPFLGQQFCFPSAAPVIAARARVPLVPVLSIRETREVVIGNPIEVSDEASVGESLKKVLAALEPFVAERPWEWWTWFHLEQAPDDSADPSWRLLNGREAFSPF